MFLDFLYGRLAQQLIKQFKTHPTTHFFAVSLPFLCSFMHIITNEEVNCSLQYVASGLQLAWWVIRASCSQMMARFIGEEPLGFSYYLRLN